MPHPPKHINWNTATLIGLSGKQYAGKDQVADLLLTYLHDFEKVPLALAIKEAYAADHNLSLEDIETNKATHRPGLIAKGDWGRAQDPQYWLKKVFERQGNKLISDVRLQREFDFIKAHGGILIRVEADRAIRATRGTLVSESDPTECELDDIAHDDWDVVVCNNGSRDELKTQIHTLVHT